MSPVVGVITEIQHNFMVALPCCYLTLRARKPRNPAYPEHLTTLGDHIRKRRLDLGMHQKDVAALVNTTTSTVTNWEKDRTSPRLSFLPGLFDFLGYNPSTLESKTLGEKLLLYRKSRGISQRELAKRIGVDPTTLSRFERGKGECCASIVKKMSVFFNRGA